MKLDKAQTTPRNSLCHCGSGIKYKKCCLKKDLETIEAQRRFEGTLKKKKCECGDTSEKECECGNTFKKELE